MHTVFHESCCPLGFICLTPDCWTDFPSRGLAPAALSFGLRALASVATLWLCACCRAAVQWSGVVADPARDQGGARYNEEDIALCTSGALSWRSGIIWGLHLLNEPHTSLWILPAKMAGQ